MSDTIFRFNPNDLIFCGYFHQTRYGIILSNYTDKTNNATFNVYWIDERPGFSRIGSVHYESIAGKASKLISCNNELNKLLKVLTYE